MIPKVPKHNRIKVGRIKNKSYMRWITTLPCLVCGIMPCDAHHPLKIASRRKFGKASDCETIPLCRPHHTELHIAYGDEDKFTRHYGLDFIKTSRELNKRYVLER